jgi:hypothetical protein
MFKHIVLGTLLALVSVAGYAQQPAKPVVEVPIEVSYSAPPATLEDATRSADAVVLVRIRGSRPYQPSISGATLRTAYQIDVLETLKLDSRLTPDSVVFRFGGDEDKGTHIRQLRESSFPAFRPGQEYVLFLKWNSVLEGFETSGGPNTAFEILSDGTVQSPGKAAFARGQAGKSKSMFLTAVRSAAKAAK